MSNYAIEKSCILKKKLYYEKRCFFIIYIRTDMSKNERNKHMKITLPLDKSIVTTIPSHANFLSIAMIGNKGIDWLCNYYVNIYVKYNKGGWRDSCKASFIDWGTLDRNYTNIVKSYFVPRFMIDSLFDFLLKSLNNNYYINLRLDDYYLPCCNIYLKRHNYHNTLISGIDFENKIVLLSDFYSQKKYQTYEVDFDSVYNAYESVSEDLIPNFPDYQFLRTEIQLMKLNDSYYEFSLNHLIQLLVDYKESKDSTGRFFNTSHIFDSFDKNISTTYIYGLDAINVIAKLFCEKKLGMQSIHLLYDRYKAMVLRINYLQKKFKLDLSEELISYQKLERNSLIMRNLCLKYIAKEEGLLVNKIQEGYNEIFEKEQVILEKFIEKLQMYNNCNYYNKL